MIRSPRISRVCSIVFLGLGFVWACGFDNTLREYLDAHFWLPFSKKGMHFERSNVRRVSAPYAGMAEASGEGALAKLREAYQHRFSEEVLIPVDSVALRQAVAEARADTSLTRREREEVDLIDAKIELRAATPGSEGALQPARDKIEAFLRTARTPEFLSEARGWLGRIHYLSGNQTAAGKIYLDELNRNGSNLSRETLLNSLRMTYGYDGGQELLDHLEEYFDTPEHAAFAIQLATNPHWDRPYRQDEMAPAPADNSAAINARVKSLLEKHTDLLKSNTGANALALLEMRIALGLGDPPMALKIAAAVPANAAVRWEPDFYWMLASAHFLSRQYAAAEQPLLGLFHSRRSSRNQKAAAAYGLCGVYQKDHNVIEQLRFALWLYTEARRGGGYWSGVIGVSDQSVYWSSSGWDLKLLLDAETPIDALESFVHQNPNLDDVRLVKYSLAVRLSRANRYEEAARIYQSISATRRAPRMRRLAALYQEANRTDLSDPQRHEAKYKLAEFISDNPDRIYFNDALWNGYQNYALVASSDSRLTRAERQAMIESERKLRDDQEERWRAYLILRDIAREAGDTGIGRSAAVLGIRCLRGISDRFERRGEIRKGDIELSRLARR